MKDKKIEKKKVYSISLSSKEIYNLYLNLKKQSEKNHTNFIKDLLVCYQQTLTKKE